MEYAKLPTKISDVDDLRQVCVFLREGSQSRDAIKDSVDITKPGYVIRYGLRLGLLEESEEKGVGATAAGTEFSYAESEEARNQVFSSGLVEYQLYSDLLDQISSDFGDLSDDDGDILRSEIEKELRITYKIDQSDYTVRQAANTFLRTLEAAGLGEYISGRGGGKGARLSPIEDFVDASREILPVQVDQSHSNHSSTDSTDVLEGDNESNVGNPSRTGLTEALSDIGQRSTLETNPLSIQLDVDGSDDPDNVRELLIAIREGLSSDLSLNEATEENEEADKEEVEKEPDGEAESPNNNLSSFIDSEDVEEDQRE